MGSTAALGLGQSWKNNNGDSVWSTRLQHGLVLALFVALGWVLCQTLWPNAVAPPLFYWASIISTCTSFTLWHALFKSVEVTRIPTKRIIRRELAEAYRPTCLQALHLDTEIAEECDDTESRDGLGEVAAWVYRLQWTLQRFDRELECQNEIDIHTRLQHAQAYATETRDAYTKERHHATIHQLHRLKKHREKIAVERERALALVDFAMVNLQEARAQFVGSSAAWDPSSTLRAGCTQSITKLVARSNSRPLVRTRDVATVSESLPFLLPLQGWHSMSVPVVPDPSRTVVVALGPPMRSLFSGPTFHQSRSQRRPSPPVHHAPQCENGTPVAVGLGPSQPPA